MNPRLKVLVVEDDAMTREIVADKLREQFDAVTACNLRECRQLFESTKPDVILLDLNLPESRSVETLAQVKSFSGDCTIVVFSGMSDPAIIRDCISRNADGYVVKNFGVQLGSSALFSEIYSAFRGKQQRREIRSQFEQA